MKIKNILLTGVAVLALTSCNDYLEVDAPSKYTKEFVYSQKSEIERSLNGVYAQALVGDLYGNAYQKTFILNSDVDIAISSSSAHSHTTYQRFDCDDEGVLLNMPISLLRKQKVVPSTTPLTMTATRPRHPMPKSCNGLVRPSACVPWSITTS